MHIMHEKVVSALRFIKKMPFIFLIYLFILFFVSFYFFTELHREWPCLQALPFFFLLCSLRVGIAHLFNRIHKSVDQSLLALPTMSPCAHYRIVDGFKIRCYQIHFDSYKNLHSEKFLNQMKPTAPIRSRDFRESLDPCHDNVTQSR